MFASARRPMLLCRAMTNDPWAPVARVARALALYAFPLALSACIARDRTDRPRRQLPAISEPPATLAATSNTVAFKRHEIARRLHADPLDPARRREEPCPDQRLASLGLDPASRTLVLRAHDARIGAKHLLPLDLVQRLETGELTKIDRLFDQPPELGGKIRSEVAARQALGAIELASKRRFRGVYHIVEYAPPALIHKVGKLRSEWVPGVLLAWLAIEEMDSGSLICQTRVLVRNDVIDEPIFRRTKSEVKERLVAELARALRAESVRALAKISNQLRLPDG